jgi:hypothetical protein
MEEVHSEFSQSRGTRFPFSFSFHASHHALTNSFRCAETLLDVFNGMFKIRFSHFGNDNEKR